MAAYTQPYYIYDPGVTSELGGVRVVDDQKKGKHVLMTPMAAQYWIDQGIVGIKPASELSGPGKDLLKQLTRGRSEDNDANPKRVPKYNKRIMRGDPLASNIGPRAAARRRKARGKPAAPPPSAA